MQAVSIAARFPTAGRAQACPIVAALGRVAISPSGWAGGGVARGRSGRCARRGAVVRLLQRAVLLDVGADGADGGGLFDAGDDPHGATALDPRGRVDVEDALEALRPAHRAALVVGAAVVAVRVDVSRRCLGDL
jgi:hypothetical protein